MPPWKFPYDYCHGIDSTLTTWVSVPHALDGDTAFCLSWSVALWQGFLYAGLTAWVVFTLWQLVGSFEWRDLSGFVTSEVLRRLARQLGLLLLAIFSFFLLQAAHQVIYLLLDLFFQNQEAGKGAPSWHTDLLWNHAYSAALTNLHFALEHDKPGFLGMGGALDDKNAPFGLTWDQISGIVDTLLNFVPGAVMALRFVAMYVVLVTAPLAILCKSNPITSPLFDLWFKYWLQLEGIAVGSIAVLACYWAMDLSQTNPTTADYVRLGLLGLVSIANLAFISLVLGNFLREGATYYTSQQQRSNAGWHGGLGILAALVGVGLSFLAGPEIGLPVGAAIASAGGAGLTAYQAQITPGAQVGPGSSISSGAGSALIGAYRAWRGYAAEADSQTPTWAEVPGGGGGASLGLEATPLTPPQVYRQALLDLAGPLSHYLGGPPSLPAYDPTSQALKGTVPTGQAIAAYLAGGGQAGTLLWAPVGQSSAPFVRVGQQLVRAEAIERQIGGAPFLRDAFQIHREAHLPPQALPGVVAVVGRYYQSATSPGRWGFAPGYSSAQVLRTAATAARGNRLGVNVGLASPASRAQRVIAALRRLS